MPSGGNHTPEFARAARTHAAHAAALTVAKALALTGFRVLADERFFADVRRPVYCAAGSDARAFPPGQAHV